MTKAREHSPERPQRDGRTLSVETTKAPNRMGCGPMPDGLGNRAVLALLRAGQIQRKARISEPGDAREREADRVADAVVAGDSASSQAHSAGAAPAAASSGGGLDGRTQALMEARFGERFDDVQVHTGPHAHAAADAVHARAFTIGSDIVFGDGQYAPDTTKGQRLLAHELVHVVQQRGAAPGAAEGRAPKVVERAPPGTVHRAPKVEVEAARIVPIAIEGELTEGKDTWYVFADGVRVATVRTERATDPVSAEAYEFPAQEPGVLNLSISATAKGSEIQREKSAGRWHTIRSPQDPVPVVPRKSTPVPVPKLRPVKPNPAPRPASPLEAPGEEPSRDEPPGALQPASTNRSHAGDLQDALAHDPSQAPHAASRLTNGELAALSAQDRLAALNAIAEHGAGGDALVLLDLIATTPAADAGALADAMQADNQRLRRALGGRLPLASALQLDLSLMDLQNRRIDQLLFTRQDMPPIDFGKLLQGPPHDPTEIIWSGNPALQPSWTRGMKMWVAPNGDTNILSPETGLAVWNRDGKLLGLPPPGADQVARALRGAKELSRTDGKRYVEGKGWLDEAGWQAHLQERKALLGAGAERKVGDLQGGTEEWAKTQGGWAYFASGPSHLLGGRWFSEPAQIVADARQDVRIALHAIEKAQTTEELQEAESNLRFAQTHGGTRFFNYKEDVYLGADRTITGIKVGAFVATAYISAPALGAYGGTALTLRLVAGGIVAGGGMSAARQGVQLAEGSRNDFSFSEVGQGALMGGGMALVPALAPFAVGMGVESSVDELSKGHYATGAFDMAGALMPFAIKGAPEFGRWARPRAAAVMLRVGTGVYDAGLGGRSFTPSLPNEPSIGMVAEAPGRLGGMPADPVNVRVEPQAAGVAADLSTRSPTSPAAGAIRGPIIGPTAGWRGNVASRWNQASGAAKQTLSRLTGGASAAAVGTFVQAYDHAVAETLAIEMIERSPAREVGIWHNQTTNEFIVVQGKGDWVGGGVNNVPTTGGPWTFLEHYHPERNFAVSMPSIDDFKYLEWLGTSHQGGTLTQAVTSRIRFRDPVTGKFHFTEYGVDPSRKPPFGPYFVRAETRPGLFIDLSFATFAEWQQHLNNIAARSPGWGSL